MLTAAGLYAPLPARWPRRGRAAAAPRGSGTETQAWVKSIMNGGTAARAAITGFAAARPVLALGLAAAAAAGAALSAAHGPTKRRTQRTHRRPFG